MMYPSRTGRLTTLSLASAAALTLFTRPLWSSQEADGQTAQIISQMIPRLHYSRTPLDDRISTKLVDAYVKALDPQKLYFLQSDIDGFQRSRTQLDDALKSGNINFANQVFDVFKQRVTARCELAHQLIDQPHDFTIDEKMIADPDDRAWATTDAEMHERWRQWIKRELLEFRLDDEPDTEARDKLHKRYRNIKLVRVDQANSDEILEVYLTSLAMCFDPHSSYMSPQTWEDFEISFRLSLDGIGAQLKGDDGYTIVAEVVPGGAADLDGRLKRDDKIIGVGQATGEIVDIFEMRLTDIVRMIRGPQGTKVRLQVKPAAGGETQVYELTRAKISLDEQAVKGEIIDTTDRVGRPGRIGVIHVPSFYRDFEGDPNDPNTASSQRDVARVLAEFAREGVDGVLVDLRFNGGGALSEAVEMSGHFLDAGPVVQVKNEEGQVKALDDATPGALYQGPLVVVCNRLSASASEIFAGVIKDYRRGLVIGDETTHGKGTVQQLMDITPSQLFKVFAPDNRGKLKLTINQFYRVNGDSTQNRGVRSDIVLPSLLDHADLGESFLDNALPFDHIQSARFSPGRAINAELIAALQRMSEQRIAQDAEFKKRQNVISGFLERKAEKTVTLNEEQARAEREDDSKDEEAEALGVGDEEVPTRDKPIFPDEFYNDELLQITLDYLNALRGGVAAKS